MKILIFAGGAGKRFWPIGREDYPKQFIPLIKGKSTFELWIQNVQPIYGWHSIFVSTNEKYVAQIKELVPQIGHYNIFTEPARRDVGPAVGLALIRLQKMGVTEPIAILWADVVIKDVSNFQEILRQAEEIVLQNKYKVVLIGETPKFANSNIGWIITDKKLSDNHFTLKDFIYRPDTDTCQRLYTKKQGLWNTAIMISTVNHLLGFYKEYTLQLYEKLLQIERFIGTPKEAEVLEKIYPTCEPIHFDHIVSYNLQKDKTLIIKSNMQWTDPGTLYSLKQFLKPGNANAKLGQVVTMNTSNSLLFNYDDNKLLAAVDLKDMIVVNTKDAILVIPADRVKDIGDLFKKLQKNKKLAKFTRSK